MKARINNAKLAEFAGLAETDWRKVAADFPQAGIDSDEDFLRFAESEGGLMMRQAPPLVRNGHPLGHLSGLVAG